MLWIRVEGFSIQDEGQAEDYRILRFRGVGFTNLYKLSLALSLSLSLFLCLYCTATYVVTIAVHLIWSFRCEGFAFQESVIMSGTTIGLGFGVLGYRASKGFNRRTPANPKLNPPPLCCQRAAAMKATPQERTAWSGRSALEKDLNS